MNPNDEGVKPNTTNEAARSLISTNGSALEGESDPIQHDEDMFQHVQTLLLQCSDGLLSATISPRTGISVFATRNLDAGTNILTCPAEGFALDPPFRYSHCGFCTASTSRRRGCFLSPAFSAIDEDDEEEDEPPSLSICPNCRLIGFCPSCRRQYSKYHAALECLAIQRLVAAFARGGDDGDQAFPPIDSTILLTVRLLCCRTNEITPSGSAKNPVSHRYQSDRTSSFSWRDFQCLYELPMSDLGGLDEELVDLFSVVSPTVRTTSNDVRATLGRVLGCSHAIVDPSLPLGSQTLGRAVFVPHSFYNHSCSPNAFISSVCGSNDDNENNNVVETKVASKDNTASVTSHPPSLLLGRVFTTCDIPKGDPVTMSYIPLSGLSLQERQTRLQQGYAFVCNCGICDNSGNTNSDSPIKLILPVDADVESIREIQFSCNERLLGLRAEQKGRMSEKRSGARRRKQKENVTDTKERSNVANDNVDRAGHNDELESIVSMIQMTVRGIQNQGLPSCHEVSIEADRLLAMAYEILDRLEEARTHHQQFLEKVSKIKGVFDPVAEATQRIEYANVIDRQKERISEWGKGIALLRKCLGKDHPWLSTLLACESIPCTPVSNEAKRPRMSQHDLVASP